MWARTFSLSWGVEGTSDPTPTPKLSLWALELGVGSNPNRMTLSGCFTPPASARCRAQPHSLLSGGMGKLLDCSVPQFPCLSGEGDSSTSILPAASGKLR